MTRSVRDRLGVEALGRHLIAEFFGCDSSVLSDSKKLEEILLEAAEAANLTVIRSATHFFDPGATSLVLIGESHLSIHTWPEYGHATVDVFVCGEKDPWIAYRVIEERLKPKEAKVVELPRGISPPSELGTPPCVVDKVVPGFCLVYVPTKYLHREVTEHQRIDLVEHEVFGKILFLDDKAQVSTFDEWIYHEALVHPAMVAHPNPKRVLILGGGDGGALREVLKHRCVEHVTLVDIDPRVIEMSKKLIPEISAGAFDDPRAELVFTDGRRFVEEYRGEPFDVAIVDVTDPISGISAKLFTKEFYEALKRVVRRDGVVCTQAEDVYLSHYTFEISFPTIVKTMESVFRVVRPLRAWIPVFGTEWGFCIASEEVDPTSLTREEVEARLSERGVETKFYCPEVHHALFAFPKNVAKNVEELGRVVCDEDLD